MNNLGETLRTVQHDSYETWFNRWIKYKNLPKVFEISAKQGYSAYSIDVNNSDDYLKRRLNDDRLLKLLNGKFPGIKIERKRGSAIKRVFGISHKVEYNRIIFSWE